MAPNGRHCLPTHHTYSFHTIRRRCCDNSHPKKEATEADIQIMPTVRWETGRHIKWRIPNLSAPTRIEILHGSSESKVETWSLVDLSASKIRVSTWVVCAFPHRLLLGHVGHRLTTVIGADKRVEMEIFMVTEDMFITSAWRRYVHEVALDYTEGDSASRKQTDNAPNGRIGETHYCLRCIISCVVAHWLPLGTDLYRGIIDAELVMVPPDGDGLATPGN